LTLALLALAALSTAHAQSIEAVIDGVRERVKEELTFRQIDNLEPGDVEALLTEEEKRILGGAYLTFEVNVPVVVSVFRDMRLEEDGEPFWLRERGFRRTEFRAEAYQEDFDVWQKAFPAGEVGLGVHALRVVREHYFVAVAPQNPEAELRITNLNPEPHTLGTVELGELIYVDRDVTLDAVSEPLVGQTLIRTESDRRPVAAVYGYYRLTDHPATPEPDQIALTWSGDPKTTQTVQWRTSTETQTGAVRYLKKSDFNRFEPQGPTRVEAQTTVLESPKTVNDLTVHRHTATLTGLEPGTSYVYAVGDGSEDGWSELYEFTTAPEGESAFSFIYLGDAQNGLDRFGSLLKAAHRERPDAAFYVMAGDLVDRGNERDDWDTFFKNTAGVFENYTLVPAIGNHEAQDDDPHMYLDLFSLPRNGPRQLPPERAYSFTYGDVLFVVLDSTLDAQRQAPWLEKQLTESDATWTFVVYHHPAYTSRPGRYYEGVSTVWAPILERHDVDMVLQGHDHAYLRTHPMEGGQAAPEAETGPLYVISNAGDKHYDQEAHPYTAVGDTEQQYWQVIDIQLDEDRLVYQSRTLDGELIDEVVLERD